MKIFDIAYEYNVYRDTMSNCLKVAIIKLKNSSGRGIFNLGSSKPRKLKEYVSIICDEINKNIKPSFGKIPYRKDQVMSLYPDITRIKKAAKWNPKIDFSNGIKNLVNYYHEN